MPDKDASESRKTTWPWTMLIIGLGALPSVIFLSGLYQTRHYGELHWFFNASLLAALWCCIISPFLSSTSLAKKLFYSVLALVAWVVVGWLSYSGTMITLK